MIQQTIKRYLPVHLALFADLDWSQLFMGGLIVCGGILIVLALAFFYRAMTASRDESKSYEESQTVYMASLVFGIALILVGLYFRNAAGIGSSDSSSLNRPSFETNSV
jgi:hypothetical protein